MIKSITLQEPRTHKVPKIKRTTTNRRGSSKTTDTQKIIMKYIIQSTEPKNRKNNKNLLTQHQMHKRLKENIGKCSHDKLLIKSLKHNLLQLDSPDLFITLQNQTLFEVCGARALIVQNCSYYQQIHQRARNYPSNYFRPIEIDIDRTIPNHPDKEQQKKVEAATYEVLMAYAIRNPYTHYCQGFNFVVASLLLKGFREDETFWIMVALLENHMPIDYYCNMINVIVDATLLKQYIDVYIYDLSAHLQKLGVDPILFLVQWFVCVFVQNVQPQLCHLIWTLLFLDGFKALHKSALVLLYHFKADFMAIDTFPVLLQLIETKLQEFTDLKLFLNLYKQITINKQEFLLAREIIRAEQLTQYKVRVEKSVKFQHPFLECNKEAPICHHALHVHRELKRTLSFEILQLEEPLTMINDYCDQPKTHTLAADVNDVLIGRGPHICSKINQTIESENPEDDIKEILQNTPYYQGISFFGQYDDNELLEDIPTLLRNDQVLNKIRHNIVRERNVCVSSNIPEEEEQQVQLDRQMTVPPPTRHVTSILNAPTAQISDQSSSDSSDDYLPAQEEQKQIVRRCQTGDQIKARRAGITYKNKTQDLNHFLEGLMESLDGHQQVDSLKFAVQFLKRFN